MLAFTWKDKTLLPAANTGASSFENGSLSRNGYRLVLVFLPAPIDRLHGLPERDVTIIFRAERSLEEPGPRQRNQQRAGSSRPSTSRQYLV